MIEDSGKPFIGDIIYAKDVTDELDKKVNTSDVLTLTDIQASTDLTGKVAGADSVKPLLNQRIYNIVIYFAESGQEASAVFQNVKIDYRISAIVVGNGDGTPFFRYCQLFRYGGATEVSIDSGTINGTDNGDGTANITISPAERWGRYNLIVFYG